MESQPVSRLAGLTGMPLMPVWTRLGYREKTAAPEIRSKYESLVEQFVHETQVRIFYVEKSLRIENNEVTLAGWTFVSRLVQERCQGTEQVLLLGASARPEDIARLDALKQAEELKSAVILDAVLSEKVDFALDFIEKELAVDLRRSGRIMGQRFSCGYGDFSLENQGIFYQALGMAEFGITLTTRNILLPEKTVTALAPLFSL